MTLKEQFARARHPLLFLALLIQPVGGQLAAAQEEPTPDYALIIDAYSGAVPPDATQEGVLALAGDPKNQVGCQKSSISNMCCRRTTSILPDRARQMDRRSLSRVMSADKWTATGK